MFYAAAVRAWLYAIGEGVAMQHNRRAYMLTETSIHNPRRGDSA